MIASASDVLQFWLESKAPSDWYSGDPALDQEIKTRFERTWQAAQQGRLSSWMTSAEGALAYIILLDQFPRNMFRDTAEAFALDRCALAAAKQAIDRQWDLKIAEPARQFFYMPLMHSENLCDQERCMRMILARMPEGGAGQLLHAKAHREVIRRFGRFPNRNAALARRSTQDEARYLQDGGYGSTVRALQAA